MHRVVMVCVAVVAGLMVADIVWRSKSGPHNGVTLSMDMVQNDSLKKADRLADSETGGGNESHATKTPVHSPHEAVGHGESLWHRAKGVGGVAGIPAVVPSNQPVCDGPFPGGVCVNQGCSGGSADRTRPRAKKTS